MPDYIVPKAQRAPQLTTEDLAQLSPQDIDRARKLGQLAEILSAGPGTTEPLSAHRWANLSTASRTAMVKAYGRSIAPTTDKN